MNNKLNILYTCDNAYLSLTSISMASVVQNNPDALITFYIATEKDNSEELKRLKDFYSDNEKIRIIYLDCKQYDDLLEEKGFDRWGSNSYYVYWKLFAYDNIEEEKIWYLDSDVLCLNPIDYPEISKSVGACLDSAHACFNKAAHINEDYYLFNTGSMFVDISKWKKNGCINKVIEYIKNIKHMPLLCDQDILAASLQEDIELLDPKYDYLVGYDYYGIQNSFEMYSLDKKPFYKEKEIEDAKDKIVFYHCLGGVFGRPWENNNESPIKEEFEKYRAVSAWPEYEKERIISTLFKIEKVLETVLPRSIYNKVHNFAMKKYIERQGKK